MPQDTLLTGSHKTLSAPVEILPQDSKDLQPEEKGIALCLSGGGYRAMLFHLGTLIRLNEMKLLPKIDRVSSVSGGSITAGVLGLNWSRLGFRSKWIFIANSDKTGRSNSKACRQDRRHIIHYQRYRDAGKHSRQGDRCLPEASLRQGDPSGSP